MVQTLTEADILIFDYTEVTDIKRYGTQVSFFKDKSYISFDFGQFTDTIFP